MLQSLMRTMDMLLGMAGDPDRAATPRTGPDRNGRGWDRPRSLQGIAADVTDVDLIDGHGGEPAVAQLDGDQPPALLELVPLALPDGPLVLGDHRRLLQQPARVETA